MWLVEQLEDIKNDLSSISGGLNAFFNTNKKDSKESSKSQTHLLDQLNDISVKLSSLEKSIAVGVPLAQASEGLSKLESLQDSISNLDSKLTLYISSSKELKAQVEDLNKLLSEKVHKSQVDSLSGKIDYLEKLYSELSVSKTNDSLVALIEIIESLKLRIKQLENTVEKEVVSYSGDAKRTDQVMDQFGSKTVGDNRKAVSEFGEDSSKSSDFSKVFTKDEEKKGFFSSFFGSIFSIFKKKE